MRPSLAHDGLDNVQVILSPQGIFGGFVVEHRTSACQETTTFQLRHSPRRKTGYVGSGLLLNLIYLCGLMVTTLTLWLCYEAKHIFFCLKQEKQFHISWINFPTVNLQSEIYFLIFSRRLQQQVVPILPVKWNQTEPSSGRSTQTWPRLLQAVLTRTIEAILFLRNDVSVEVHRELWHSPLYEQVCVFLNCVRQFGISVKVWVYEEKRTGQNPVTSKCVIINSFI